MRILAVTALLLIPAAGAHAEPADDARSATGACLSAVIDGAPVGDIDDGPITIRRGKDPVSCTVGVSDGQPVVIRDAVLAAIRKRSELFTPAKTRWSPGDDASREAFCNLSLRRPLNVFVSTGKPGRQPVATVTVFESAKRDERCDRDMGLQTVAANDAAVAPVTQPATPPATKPKPKKKSWLSRLPGL